MINSNTIIPEFTTDDFKAIVQAYPLGNLKYRGYFPLEYSPTLSFSNLEYQEGAKIMADVVALGSRAPRKGRDYFESIKGEIPKIEIARDKTEKDFINIQTLRNSRRLSPENTSIRDAFIKNIYDDSLFCIDGVNARLEYLAKKLASTGKYELSKDNHDFSASLMIDFEVPKIKPSKTWDKADANPIQDIMDIQELALGMGFQLAYMTTDSATLNKVLNNVNVRAFVFGVALNSSSVLPNITLERLNNELLSRNLPIFNVWNSFVSSETKSGEIVSTNAWELGNVTFSISDKLGATKYFVSPEFTMNFSDTQDKAVKDDFILVTTYGYQDPMTVSTKATSFAVPVLNNVSKTLILEATNPDTKTKVIKEFKKK